MTTTKRLLTVGCVLYAVQTVLRLLPNVWSGIFSKIFGSYPAEIAASVIAVYVVDLAILLIPALVCLRRDFTAQRKTPAVWLLVICSLDLISGIASILVAIPYYLTLTPIAYFSIIAENLATNLLRYAALVLFTVASIRCLRVPNANENRRSS